MPDPLIDLNNVVIEPLCLHALTGSGITADVLRLDKIHPVVSGNKWFKLRLYLEKAMHENHHTVVTFGGAWSNHIVATAYAARQYGLRAVGIIRGEAPASLSQTLEAAASYGMELHFTSRNDYKILSGTNNPARYGNHEKVLVIPEGGFGREGIEGSEAIVPGAVKNKYTHILCCIGTGTMFTGIANAASHQQVIGIPVLKGMEKIRERLAPFLHHPQHTGRLTILHDYHFGGYARKTPALIRFMNDFYVQTGIPTDFVYTAKLFYACTSLAATDYFAFGSRILIIHSGGLQGNKSLAAGTLVF